MYESLVAGEVVTMTGSEAESFCEKYVQTLTEDGEVYIMPQEYPWYNDMVYTVELNKVMPNGMLVVYLD